MAFSITGMVVSMKCVPSVELNTKKHRFVVDTASGVQRPSAAGSVTGVQKTLAPSATNPCAVSVQLTGVIAVEAGAACPAAAALKVDASGRVVPQGGSGVIVGTAMEAAAAAGDIIAVNLEQRA